MTHLDARLDRHGPRAGRAKPAIAAGAALAAGLRRLLHPPAVLLALLTLVSAPAQAHKASDAYLFLASQAGQTTLRWDIALRDLDAELPLDADNDRQLTWGEVQRAWPQIDQLALAALQVPGCRFSIASHALEQRSDGAYAVLNGSAPCQVQAATPVRYALFHQVDPTHRGLLRLTVDGQPADLRMLVPAALPSAGPASALRAGDMPAASGDIAAGQAATSTTAGTAAAAAAAAPADAPADAHAPSFIGEGVHHIITGYDHLLFLLCLLLPAVLRRQDGHWAPVANWRQALWPVARTVTLFTLAHSVTLALAALGWVRLSPSFIEPAIAATIMLAAFDNLRPWLLRWRGWVTFGFGLIHGFGFAGVLAEMDLPASQFGWALLQFNLGLELGQLALVLLVVPLLFALRRRAAYVPGVLRAGSVGALLLAGIWLLQRTVGVGLDLPV